MEITQADHPEVISLSLSIWHRFTISCHDVAERLVGFERAKWVAGDQDQMHSVLIGCGSKRCVNRRSGHLALKNDATGLFELARGVSRLREVFPKIESVYRGGRSGSWFEYLVLQCVIRAAQVRKPTYVRVRLPAQSDQFPDSAPPVWRLAGIGPGPWFHIAFAGQRVGPSPL